jgi:hypothetical protein
VMISTKNMPLSYAAAASGAREARLSSALCQKFIGPFTLGLTFPTCRAIYASMEQKMWPFSNDMYPECPTNLKSHRRPCAFSNLVPLRTS